MQVLTTHRIDIRMLKRLVLFIDKGNRGVTRSCKNKFGMVISLRENFTKQTNKKLEKLFAFSWSLTSCSFPKRKLDWHLSAHTLFRLWERSCKVLWFLIMKIEKKDTMKVYIKCALYTISVRFGVCFWELCLSSQRIQRVILPIYCSFYCLVEDSRH